MLSEYLMDVCTLKSPDSPSWEGKMNTGSESG